ncbi:MFS transporter, OFA family, oxalate/formate antiporter [Clostridium acidisoli DSM 12555]|jgi:OFA family oxalate/formate antiporter-like MFS transporter|uniref:MFS transporter, OFA family, oxalate/formate antiporter n=1 Tax=Clostridium acidisoli DSM 12555 TaxID=1121291 RepID=A0A1W1XVQ0_9CLOT|nr:OFA family MFS transporter [Clostridium acidisoli]SMC28013.1 MFS transporter, OFA family, oxalate/formate antiporter [Clostridium acidisoli DSM 12555]
MLKTEKQSNSRLLILIGTIITQIGLGTIYTWSLFNQPLADKFGWQLSRVSVTFSITSFALAFATLFAGKIQDKIGIRKLITLSGIILGGGLILTSKVNSIGMLYLTAGVIVGAADGIAYMTSLSNCIKWFPEKKGLISGISVGSYGAGSLIFKYVNSGVISSKGVTFAFLCWGIIAFILVSGGAQLLKDAQEVTVVDAKAEVKNDYTPTQMLKKKEAYLLFIMMFTACMSGLYLIGIVKDIGVQLAGLNTAVAANAVAMVAIFNTAGRIILGALSDKVGRLKVLLFTFAVTAISVFVMDTVHLNFGIFFACVAGIAFCFGGNITVFPAIVGDFFGLKNHSKNYGIIYQGFGIGALSGSVIASIAGSFKATFVVIGVMCLISIVIALTIRVPQEKTSRRTKLEGRTA